jgi:hypothetical protein
MTPAAPPPLRRRGPRPRPGRCGVTLHAIDRFRERNPACAAWADDEIAARIRWHVGQGVRLSGGLDTRRLGHVGLVFVVREGTVITVLTEQQVTPADLESLQRPRHRGRHRSAKGGRR